MTEPMMDDLEKRLSYLESANRRLKQLLALLGIALVLGLVAIGTLQKPSDAPVVGRTIETERLVIKDPTGKVRAVLGRHETSGSPQSQYGLFIHGKDGESEARLTDSNLHIHYDKGSANFSPISVDITEHKVKVSQLFREASRLSDMGTKQKLTKQEQDKLERLSKEFEPIAQFYLNMSGPYLELKKHPRNGETDSGSGEVHVGASAYPTIGLRAHGDKTSFSLSALKDVAGMTIRDRKGNKRVTLNVDTDNGAAMNLYDIDGKTFRAAFGNVTLETIRTGGIQKRPASSLVLFDKDGKTYWRTP